MEIILKQDIPGLGYKNDVIIVKDGYARNFLIPKGLATSATPSRKKAHTEILKQKAHKEEKIKNEALELEKKLKELSLTIGAKTSSKGKIFGSVNTVQIAEALKEKGFDIDRKNISFKEELIKEVGKYTALIRLHREVQAEIPFEIIAE
jgi:large subunit ribosomal protein L9